MRHAEDSRHDLERRNRLAYLALHYAILGEDARSEKIRDLIWQLDQNAPEGAETPEDVDVQAVSA